MLINLLTTIYSFYSHNAPLVFYGIIVVLLFIKLLIKPSRLTAFLLLGFAVLLFNFEYGKHIFSQVKSHWLDLIFPEGTRFTKYNVLRVLLENVLPIVLDILGWGIITAALIIGVKGSNKK